MYLKNFCKAISGKFARFARSFLFVSKIYAMKQKEKEVSSKISDLSDDIIKIKIFEETYFLFLFYRFDN